MEKLTGLAGGAEVAAGGARAAERRPWASGGREASGFREALDAAQARAAGDPPAAARRASRPAVAQVRETPGGMAFTPGFTVPPASAGEKARLRWAAQQLEALFLEQLWRGMRRTVMTTGMLDGPGVRMFEELLDQERAVIMAEAGALGLADLIYEQMSQYVSAPAVETAARTATMMGRTTAGGREVM
ncbi:MAG TPA: rod-binding protein [Limnochordales bacterium]